MCEKLVGRLRAAGHDDEIAVDRLAVDGDLANLPLAALRADRPRLLLPEVDELGDRDAGPAEVVDRGEATIVDGENDGAFARLQRPEVDEPPDCGREDDADEIVAREHQGLIRRARCADHVLGAESDEQVAVLDRDETALVDADRRRRSEDVDADVSRADDECTCLADRVRIREQIAPGLRPLVDESDVIAPSCRVDRRLEPSATAPDDEGVDVAMLDVETLSALGLRVERAKASGIPQELLVERPESLGPDERLVVETRWCERSTELVGHRHPVAVERTEDVLRLDDGTRRRGQRADTHVRDAVHRHQAVGAVAGAALEPARAVVLEAP